jgi:hypothetical protein
MFSIKSIKINQTMCVCVSRLIMNEQVAV